MPYKPHYRVRIEGVFGDPAAPLEIWSTGFTVGVPGGTGVGPALLTPPTAALDPLRTATAAWIGRATTLIDTQGRWVQGKVTPIGADGKAAGVPAFFSPVTPVAGGGAAGDRHPLQVTAVVSLIGQAEVHRRMGRMYVPYTKAAIDSNTMGMETAARNGLLASTVTYLNEAQEAFQLSQPELRIVIAGKDRIDGSPAFNSDVVTLRVGNILDTQRRRRNGLPEAYAVGNLA